MTYDFAQLIMEDARAALKRLLPDSEEDFGLILKGIHHPDYKVCTRLINALYYPFFEGKSRLKSEQQQRILDALQQRWEQETLATVQTAIIGFFVTYTLRNGLKDERYRSMQRHALAQSAPEVVLAALHWSIFYRSPELLPILDQLRQEQHTYREVRACALVLLLDQSEPPVTPAPNAEDYCVALSKSDPPHWATLAVRQLHHFQTEAAGLALLDYLDQPRNQRTYDDAVVKHIGTLAGQFGDDSPVAQRWNQAYSPNAVLSNLVETPVNQNLTHPDTWAVVIKALSSGQGKLSNTFWYIHAQTGFGLLRVEQAYKEALAIAPLEAQSALHRGYQEFMEEFEHSQRF